MTAGTVEQIGPAERKRSLFFAMGISGGASILSGLLSAAATKIIAVSAGPASMALLSTLQQVRQTALVTATGNGQTALIRGASSTRGAERSEYLRTSAGIFAVLTALVGAFLAAGDRIFPQLSRGVALPAGSFHWLAIMVMFSSVFVFVSGLLAALGGTGRLALLQLASPLAMAAGALACAVHEKQIVAARTGYWLGAILTVAAGTAMVAAIAALVPDRHTVRAWLSGAGRFWSGEAAQQFVGTAGTMLISGVFSSLVLLAVRANISSRQGLIITGQFDAAWNISMNQAALVLASLQTHYLPAVARLRDPEERAKKISQVFTAGSLAAAAVIIAIILLRPWVIATLYSSAFAASAQYLRWTLLGDYLKVGSWIFSIPILATGNWAAFFLADLAAYSTFALVTLALTLKTGAATAASVAFILMYVVHLVFCIFWLWRKQGILLSRETWIVWMGALTLIFLTSGLTWGWQ